MEVCALRHTRPSIALAIIAVIMGLTVLAPAACARDIYVRLAQGGSCAIASDADMTLTGASGERRALGRSATIKMSGARVIVGKDTLAMPVRVTSAGLLRFDGKSYRGDFLFTQKGGMLNVLDMEDYLRGVLPAEVGASWPMEALRAQAIISRTYALRQSMGRAKKGYDVVDSVSDQVYRGAGAETARTDQAVSSTAQEIVAHGNELAFTPFHSDSGGHTADNADVWTASLPYLKGVPEPVGYASPNASWTAKIPRATIERAVGIRPVGEIRVARVDKGGRAAELTFVGPKGSKTIKASQFRTKIGPKVLKSTMLTSSPGAPAPRAAPAKAPAPPALVPGGGLTTAQERQLARMTADGVFTTSELIDMLADPKRKAKYYLIGLQRTGQAAPPPALERESAPKASPAPAPSSPRPGGTAGMTIAKDGDAFVFHGRGWGHGVGLSQWGAQALAKEGWTAEKILEHYYPGTTVKRYR